MTNQKNGTSWALTVLSNEVIPTLASGEGLQEGLQVVPLRLWNDMEIKELAATQGCLGGLASGEVFRFYCSGGA